MQNYKDYKADLSNCDTEPIHLIGRIQPHGFLLILNADTFMIEQVSSNISSFLPVSGPEELLGKTLPSLIGGNNNEVALKSLLKTGKETVSFLTLYGTSFFEFCYEWKGKLVLECEPYSACSDTEKIKHSLLLAQLHSRLSTIEKLESLGEVVAEEIRKVLDFNRVDVMRFGKEWHTEVIAESITENMGSYLGHHFPASDIPEPARALLLQKTVRQIPDVYAQAVDIIPYYNPTTQAPTDILKSQLRNPSEIHLQYLKNMQVAATISFSILVRGELWGIITCHKTTPAFINIWRRQLCELMTQTFASSVAAIQETQDTKQYDEFKKNKQIVIENLQKFADIKFGFAQSGQSLLSFTESTGGALVMNDGVLTFGASPSVDQVKSLINWLTGYTDQKVFTTRSLSPLFAEATSYADIASGVMALEMSRYNKEYLLFFKPEIAETRIWAGDPAKPSLNGGLSIHPRKSFDKWKQIIKGKSQSWSMNEIDVAGIFVKDITAIQLRDQAIQHIKLNKQLETNAQHLDRRNKELKDFGLIMAHNLRGPMGNIENLCDLYKDDPNEETAVWVMERIADVAKNIMQTLADLNVIIKTRLEDRLPSEDVNLIEIIQKEWQSLPTEAGQEEAELVTDLQVPALTFPKVYIESILHNFISNGLKYRSSERRARISIATWRKDDNVSLSVTDNGLGMDLDKVGDKVFGLYKTFHRHKDAKGLGLYVTKMQIESLGGQVFVQSQPNQGTTFTVVFPT